jgi:hypothetical protein
MDGTSSRTSAVTRRGAGIVGEMFPSFAFVVVLLDTVTGTQVIKIPEQVTRYQKLLYNYNR